MAENAKISNKDPLGIALLDYINGDRRGFIKVDSSLDEEDNLWVSQFFRNYENMPKIEKLALSYCNGKVLDVGAGAGAHSLYIQEKGLEVYPIDISEGAVIAMQKRGLKNSRQIDFFKLGKEKYDTLLLLMNGIGIVGNIKNLPSFFAKCKDLLTENGCIIFDSSDIIYMYEDEYGQFELDHEKYYGEVRYKMTYKDSQGAPFDWLFIDYGNLKVQAEKSGFRCELIYQDQNNAYLCRCFAV